MNIPVEVLAFHEHALYNSTYRLILKTVYTVFCHKFVTFAQIGHNSCSNFICLQFFNVFHLSYIHYVYVHVNAVQFFCHFANV